MWELQGWELARPTPGCSGVPVRPCLRRTKRGGDSPPRCAAAQPHRGGGGGCTPAASSLLRPPPRLPLPAAAETVLTPRPGGAAPAAAAFWVGPSGLHCLRSSASPPARLGGRPRVGRCRAPLAARSPHAAALGRPVPRPGRGGRFIELLLLLGPPARREHARGGGRPFPRLRPCGGAVAGLPRGERGPRSRGGRGEL